MYSSVFNYNSRGFGNYVFSLSGDEVISIPCRTGSINNNGELVNAIEPGLWVGKGKPLLTNEKGMNIVWFIGWKYRYWKDGTLWTHYLSHPDGNLPGSLGCIVSVEMHDEYFTMFSYIHSIVKQKELNLIVSKG